MFDMTPLFYDFRTLFPTPNRLLNEAERAFFTGTPSAENNFFRTDIRQTDSGYLLEAELPGFKKEEIAVDLEGKTLTITAKKEENDEKKDEKEGYLRKERRTGSYSRSFRLNGIRTEDVTASYEDGILRIELPKKELPAPEKRRLAVN
ncbi:MAG: Hsp20/alpha crystallin family protein [Lachnospiraceae bacterium]|nr:Hsp20/alpha crystallin family protein [Lachnospiraceae bacterium]